MFRHERPQAGRYRELWQAGFETLGTHDPVADAELILVAYNFYKDIGLPVEVHINSIGTPEEREKYKTELVNYYRAKRSYLCEDCRKRLGKTPASFGLQGGTMPTGKRGSSANYRLAGRGI